MKLQFLAAASLMRLSASSVAANESNIRGIADISEEQNESNNNHRVLGWVFATDNLVSLSPLVFFLGSPGGGDEDKEPWSKRNNCNIDGFWAPPPDEKRCRLKSGEKVCSTPGPTGFKGFEFNDLGDGLFSGFELIIQRETFELERLPLIGTYDPISCDFSAVSSDSSLTTISGTMNGKKEMNLVVLRSGGGTRQALAYRGPFIKQEEVDILGLGGIARGLFFEYRITKQGEKGNCTVVDNDSLGGIYVPYLAYQPNPTSESTTEDEGDTCAIQVYDTSKDEFIGDAVTIVYTAASYPSA